MALQKQLGSRQSNKNAVTRTGKLLMKHKTGDDRVVLKKKLQDLEREWEKVCQMSIARQDKLENAYKKIGQFRYVSQSVNLCHPAQSRAKRCEVIILEPLKPHQSFLAPPVPCPPLYHSQRKINEGTILMFWVVPPPPPNALYIIIIIIQFLNACTCLIFSSLGQSLVPCDHSWLNLRPTSMRRSLSTVTWRHWRSWWPTIHYMYIDRFFLLDYYHIAGKFGGELNLVVWRSILQPPN